MHYPQCVKSPDDNCVNCNPKCVNCETDVAKTCADCGHAVLCWSGLYECGVAKKLVKLNDEACAYFISQC